MQVFLLVALNTASPSVIVLYFAGIGDNASMDEFYNGGTDRLSNSGVDYDISFGSNGLELIDLDDGRVR